MNPESSPFLISHNHDTPSSPGMYIITSQRTGKHYIGSSNNLRVRRHRHLRELLNKEHYNPGLQELFNDHPDQLVFTYTLYPTKEEALQAEGAIIDRSWLTGKMSGKLMNLSRDVFAPGRGIEKTPEQREAIRQRLLGGTVSDEVRARISQTLTGRKLSEEHAEKARTANLGKKFDPEHKARISEALKGKLKSDGAKASMKLAKPNPIIINGIEYFNITQASQKLKMPKSSLFRRLQDPKNMNYRFKDPV